MKIHILSDVHTEHKKTICSLKSLIDEHPELKSDGYDVENTDLKNTILLLCGDIGCPLMENYWGFLFDCAVKYKFVVVVLGNHEYYGSRIEDINKIVKEHEGLKIHKNLHILQRETVILDGIKFIGVTLWSDIPSNENNMMSKRINDYKCIKMGNKMISPEDTTKIHLEDVKWITSELAFNDSLDCVIITHFLPSKKSSHEKYKIYDEISKAFYTDLEYLLCDKIKLWACGHTHTPTECKIGATMLITNPLGYKGENKESTIKEIEI